MIYNIYVNFIIINFLINFLLNFLAPPPSIERKRRLDMHDNVQDFDRTWRGCDKQMDLFQLQPQEKVDGKKLPVFN